MRHIPALAWCLLALWLLPTPALSQDDPAAYVRLEGDQTLEDLAQTLFGDREAADEIRVINQLAEGSQPESGTTLRLPGPERKKAFAALNVARQAVERARGAKSAEFATALMKAADQSMLRALRSCRRASYTACQQLADETWARARKARKEAEARRPRKNRFSVALDDQGVTRVEVSEGDGVKVTAQKQTQTVQPGHGVRVAPGKTPENPRPLLPAPEAILPFPGSTLLTRAIQFHWKPVSGAVRYVLLISHDAGGLKPVRQLTTDKTSYLFRSTLAQGEYHWLLRAVDAQGAVGQASAARSFVLKHQTSGLSVEGGDPEQKGP